MGRFAAESGVTTTSDESLIVVISANVLKGVSGISATTISAKFLMPESIANHFTAESPAWPRPAAPVAVPDSAEAHEHVPRRHWGSDCG